MTVCLARAKHILLTDHAYEKENRTPYGVRSSLAGNASQLSSVHIIRTLV